MRGGDDADPTTRSVSLRSSSVIPTPVTPPPGISKREEYDPLSRARSHVKSRGESGTQSSAGNEYFEEPTGSTPERNGNLFIERSSGSRSSRRHRCDPPVDDDPSSSSSSSSSGGGGRGGGGNGDDDDPDDFGSSPIRRREKSRHRHTAEASEIRLEALKPIVKYPEWCSSLADAVMAASSVGDRVWNWIEAPAHRNAAMGAMADPGDKYRSLDAKLARALRTAANGNATYQVRTQEEFSLHTAEEEAEGRKTGEERGTHYSPKHIYILRCPNDKKLELFLNEWHTTLARIPKSVDED